MSSLENLTAKILQDAEGRAVEIVEKARAEAGRILAQSEAEADAQRDSLMAQAHTDAERAKEQIVNGEQLKLRDRKLAAKQETIDRVFAIALERLNAGMNEKEYLRFLESYLVDAPIAGTEQVVLPARFQSLNLAPINLKRIAAGKVGQLTAAQDAQAIDGGFVLTNEGAQNKFTFDSLLDYYRDELEREVVQALF